MDIKNFMADENVIMTLKFICDTLCKCDCNKTIVKYDMRKLAIEKAIKALEDQLKYEAALELMAKDDMGHPCRNCLYEVKGETCWQKIPDDCIEGTILYYKQQVGLE